MEYKFGTRLKHAWNIFMNKDPTLPYYRGGGSFSYERPDRRRPPIRNERTIINAINNRFALDAAAIRLEHVRVDKNRRYLDTVDSGLNRCLTLEANLDQTGRAFEHDMFLSMLDEGVIAVVPTDTSVNPNTGAFDIDAMRVGKVVGWMPEHVKVELYNERNGRREEVTVPKRFAAVIENPFYTVMNAPNSTLQRLLRKLTILDAIDEQSGSGKLDLIIQLPYVVKNKTRREQAEERRRMVEEQLAGSKYGIAYTDGTERITQLNRPLENNLLKQIEYLTDMLYSQLGISVEILNGTADETTMLNYNNRIIEPLLSAVADEMNRKFLTQNARTRGQLIMFFRDPFKLVPVSQLAEIADKFTRNEIMSSNEVRQIIAMKPSSDPAADELRNKNLSQSEKTIDTKKEQTDTALSAFANQNERST